MYGILKFLYAVFFILFAFTFIYLFDFGFQGVLASSLVSSFFSIALLIFLLRNQFTLSFNFKEIRSTVRSSSPLFFKSFLNLASANIDKVILGGLLGVGSVGVLSVGQKIGDSFFKLTSAIDNTYVPKVYRMIMERKEGWAKEAGEFLTPFLYLFLLIVMLFTSLGEELTYLVGKRDYSDVSLILVSLLPYYAILFFGKQKQVSSRDMNHLTPIYYCIRILIAVPCYYILIPSFGVYGVALSLSLTEIIVMIIIQTVNQRIVPIEWEVKKIFLFFSLITLGGGVTFYLSYFKPFNSMSSLLLKLVVPMVYIFLGFKMRIFSRFKEMV